MKMRNSIGTCQLICPLVYVLSTYPRHSFYFKHDNPNMKKHAHRNETDMGI
jgi:hypothetical protein